MSQALSLGSFTSHPAPNELEAAVEANLDSPESPTLINPRVLGLQSRLFGLAMKRPPAAEAAGMGSTMFNQLCTLPSYWLHRAAIYDMCQLDSVDSLVTTSDPQSRQSRSNWPAGDTHSLAPCRRRTGPTALWLFLTLSWSNPLQKKKKQEQVASL